MKKIKVTVSKNIYDIVRNDLNDFGLSNNHFMNYLFSNLKDNYEEYDIKRIDKLTMNKVKKFIQFNLNKENSSIYYDVLRDKKVLNESEFMRNLLIKYTSQQKNVRELFIFKEIIERIKLAIKDKKNIVITFNDERKVVVTPYHIASSDLEIANYIFCYDMEEKKYKNYKLSNLKQVYTLSELGKWDEEEYIKNIVANFDPFLSQGRRIKLRLTDEGIRLLKVSKLNRPKIISREANVFEFECSEEQAKKYFSYFLDEALILEPLELRKWFEKKFENALKKIKEI
ncbi:MAG: WYL domain-containing protein [Fusobacterium sp.]|uniref:WYL domain-containing protein n=1 Tax=Fusobacterium sp. TaxID=68766 RepID=UPI0026DAA51B|nr:WYL domain-containing protein [Fusobacterium sp.]MDO4690478.1 WYL domain-containing protein [Fusobacterium sp.]